MDKGNSGITLRAFDGSKGALLMAEYHALADCPLLLHFKSRGQDEMFGLDKREAYRLLEFLVERLLPDMKREEQ